MSERLRVELVQFARMVAVTGHTIVHLASAVKHASSSQRDAGQGT
jgi:hypothetical protein